MFGFRVLGFGAFPNRVAGPDFTVTLSSNVNNYNGSGYDWEVIDGPPWDPGDMP